jgi:MFS transporter, DHA1 family, multidrug resistance protein
MTGASLSVSNEQQGGVAGLVTAMQGVSAIIAPILSTSLYHANKHIPMGLIVLLATLLSLFMLRVSQKKFSKNEIREMHNIP